MPFAEEGDLVTVHFESRRPDGTVAETTYDDEPITVVLGAGTINPAFDAALRGMQEGETTTVSLPAKQAYGEYKKRLIFKLKRKILNLPEEPEEDQIVRISLPNGKKSLVTVLSVTKTTIVVDANHPLAGEDLTYQLEVIDIGKKSVTQQ